MGKSIYTSVELTSPARAAIRRLTDCHGGSDATNLARILEWIGRQPDAIQRAASGQAPPQVLAAMAQLDLAAMRVVRPKAACGTDRGRT
jgi:hypothetical protein